MGRRRPKPPSLKAPLSASSVEMMDFAMFHLMFHTNRVQETYYEKAPKVPRVSYTGDSFASTSSVLTKWLFGEKPNSRSCDEFSERIQIVPFTMGMS